jgi:hypothetical protein
MQPVSNSRYTHFPRRTNLGEVVGQTQIDRKVLEQIFFVQEDSEATDVDEDEATAPTNQKPAARPITKKPKGPAAREKGIVEQRTPAATRFVGVGKENMTPMTGSSRKSKEAATAKIHELTPDIALYEKEKKRVGGVIYGGRRKSDEDRVEVTRKRSVDDAMDTDDTDENEPKKARKGLPPPTMHLLISNYARWRTQPRVEDVDRVSSQSLFRLDVLTCYR